MVMHLSGSGGMKLLVTSQPVSVTWVVPAAPATLWLVNRDSMSSSSPMAHDPFKRPPQMGRQPGRHPTTPLLDGRFQELGLAHGMVDLDPFVDPDCIADILRVSLRM